jgi:starch synthase (maltosyl-transferring)
MNALARNSDRRQPQCPADRDHLSIGKLVLSDNRESTGSSVTPASKLKVYAGGPDSSPPGHGPVLSRVPRPAIEAVTPMLDAGRHPIKRIDGQRIKVEADIFADGHDLVSAVLKHRLAEVETWSESPMVPSSNDRWSGEFEVKQPGLHYYTIEAWVDHFKSWRREIGKKSEAGQNITIELRQGAELIEAAAQRATGEYADLLRSFARDFAQVSTPADPSLLQRALGRELALLMEAYPDRDCVSIYDPEVPVLVDPVLARFGAWYEMFPRSCAAEPGRQGTFKDCEARLPRIANMGFDVLYFPPIHPIGKTLRRGKNNSAQSEPGDAGSPWGIGTAEGGHKAVNPDLGTLEDFRRLVVSARRQGIEIALDIAFQCSPDHPYVREHPEWFHQRPDGSIQYAENPPKKYEDIYPFDFECGDWRALWRELKSIFDFWIEQGVHVFRADNPHTKAFLFWEWCLPELKRENPELIFLAEAFTRPKVMYHLARLGFSQSYNYFPWRNTKQELTEYFTELTQGPVAEFFRPNLWANTPDILTEYLQQGGRPAFIVRLILAATLGASYGIYGPAFELCENIPREQGSEEYLNSEKYEIRHWDLDNPQGLEDLITRVNRIRRVHPALQSDERLRFHHVDNEQLIAYSKITADGNDAILTVVNLDPHHVQRGWLDLALEEFNLKPDRAYQVHDLLTDARFLWNGPHNYVELTPDYSPAHIFALRHHVRSEHDFDYFA